ncbi:hypothetical protein BT63DRAFT_428300 [Microthyrium microscopicum]|uniref:RNI-like protein n=1 Tax=Microthyrium microscopicum TaxID=703497 RepID=A0A6A6TZ23_9PEZI|nr:hypothetical protein BT63DRAFT_428300 [Microthyrium microscopicum]
MHRTLLLPEIIAQILHASAASPGFLHTCLRINKLFSLEVTRMLWKGCGVRYNFAKAGHVTPSITDLARIVQTSTKRAQYYAEFIQILMFEEDGTSWEDRKEEARWHPELATLRFSNLLSFSLFGGYGFPESRSMSTGEIILHYAQPNVKEFHIDGASKLVDSFLDTLSYRCPRLEVLNVENVSDSHLSERGMIRFLDATKHLKVLSVRTTALEGWTLNTFKALSVHSKLELLSVPDLPEPWLRSLGQKDCISSRFPKLKHFYTGISDEGLKLLALCMPNIKTLSLLLQNVAPSHQRHILRSASDFKHLTSLSIEFAPESSIDGDDMIILAQSCPNLQELLINEYDDHGPSVVNFTDATIERVAQSLKHLSKITFTLDSSHKLTWRSVIQFAQHCKELEQLTLPCNFSWQEVIDQAPAGLFPKLWFLVLVLEKNNQKGGEVDSVEEETLDIHVANLVAFAPRLRYFRLSGGDTMDESFTAAFSRATGDFGC